MSKALAFVAGIVVVVTAAWFLFAPDADRNAFNSIEPAMTSGTPVATGEAPRPAGATDETTPRSGNSPQGTTAPRWPNPEATAALPARQEHAAHNTPDEVTLWQPTPGAGTTVVDGVPAARLTASPDALAGLHLGQQVVLPVPDLNRSVTARLTRTHNQHSKTVIFRGPVTGGSDQESVLVTRGETSTYVVITTHDGVYSAVIDNRSGDTILTREPDGQDRLARPEAASSAAGRDQTPPESPSG